MKPIDIGQRHNFQYDRVWNGIKIKVNNFHSIYDYDALGEDCVRSVEYAEFQIRLKEEYDAQ